MLQKCKVICSFDQEVEGHKILKGQEYEVQAHPMDKGKWYLIFPENQWVLVDKFYFDHIVTNFVVHKAYGDFQLPIVGKDENVFIVITPTGYATSLHQSDVVVGKYNLPQKIDCSEVRFR